MTWALILAGVVVAASVCLGIWGYTLAVAAGKADDQAGRD